MTLHGQAGASSWVQRWSHLAPPGARVLDVACGEGRHMKWFAALGFQVTGVDRSEEALALASQYGITIQADMEQGAWPILTPSGPVAFDVVVVTNYLWRPLFPTLLQSLAPGGLLLYETFACGNASVGKPSRPDFLLQPGELLARCGSLQIIAFEDGFLDQPERFVQRIAAIKPIAASDTNRAPKRYLLSLK